jgi:hypothetical protein
MTDMAEPLTFDDVCEAMETIRVTWPTSTVIQADEDDIARQACVWFQVLHRYDSATVTAAITTLAATQKWAPALSEIREACDELQPHLRDDVIPTAAAAWAALVDAVQTVQDNARRGIRPTGLVDLEQPDGTVVTTLQPTGAPTLADLVHPWTVEFVASNGGLARIAERLQDGYTKRDFTAEWTERARLEQTSAAASRALDGQAALAIEMGISSPDGAQRALGA